MEKDSKQNELAQRIGKNLKKYRGERKQSDIVNEVSKKIGGLYSTTYSNYETGKRLPTIEVLLALADIYGVTVDDLCRVDDSEKVTTAESLLRLITTIYESGWQVIEIKTNKFNYPDYPGITEDDMMDWGREGDEHDDPPPRYNATITINEPVTGEFLSAYAPIADIIKSRPDLREALGGAKEKLFSNKHLREVYFSGRKG